MVFWGVLKKVAKNSNKKNVSHSPPQFLLAPLLFFLFCTPLTTFPFSPLPYQATIILTPTSGFRIHLLIHLTTSDSVANALIFLNIITFSAPGPTHSRTSSLRSLLRRLEETSDSRKIRLRSDSDWFVKNNRNGRK